jgi:hypothetical protein
MVRSPFGSSIIIYYYTSKKHFWAIGIFTTPRRLLKIGTFMRMSRNRRKNA